MTRYANALAALGVLTLTSLPAEGQSPDAQSPNAPEIKDVTVTGTRPGVTTSIDSRTYLLDRDLNATTGTLADALRNVPSVQVDLNGGLTLRGDPNVQILVDGKPSPLFVEPARAQTLMSYPAKNIERVEVMTTPSAAYSPEGSGGIINLITRNPSNNTTNASISAQYGSAGAQRYSGTYSRRAGKLTVSATGNWNKEVAKTIEREARSAATTNSPTLESTGVHTFLNKADFGTATLNATYDATPKWQIAANLTQTYVAPDFTENVQYRSTQAGIPVSAFDLVNTTPRLEIRITGAGSTLTRKFDGQEHDLSASYNYSRTAQFGLIESVVAQSIPSTPVQYVENFAGVARHQNRYRLNYRGPLSSVSKVTLGFERQDDEFRYDTSVARGLSPGTVVADPALGGLFPFTQRIDSAFGTIERPVGTLSMQLGLRLEATSMSISGLERDYSRAYPTLNFTEKLSDAQSLRGGYSRRVQRPGFYQLDPRRIPLNTGDGLTLSEGNPDLQPQETDSFELGYQYGKAQTSYLATLYWRNVTGEFVDVRTDLSGGRSLTRPENLGSSHSGGLELVANNRLSSALRYSLSTNAFWKEVDAGNLGFVGARSAFGISGNASLTWDATAKDALQLNAIATGKQLTAQGYQAPFATMNLGWRHTLNQRVAATLTVRDALYTSRYKTVIDTPTLKYLYTTSPTASRAAWLQLSYLFGAGKAAEPSFDYGN